MDELLKVIIDADDSKLQASLTTASQSIKAFGDKMQGIGQSMQGISLAFGLLGGGALKASADFEQASISIETMLGDVDLAKKTLAEWRAFADKSPLEFSDIQKAGETMLGFGLTLDKVNPAISMLTDISRGNAEKFKSLSLVYAQVGANGKLMGQDLLQMINAGFNPLTIISQKTGKSMAQLRKEMEQGRISFEDVTDAMETATSKGGMFYKMTEKQAGTLAGTFSTASDAITTSLAELGNEIATAFNLKEVIPQLTQYLKDAVQAFKELDPNVKKVIVGLGGIVTVASPLLMVGGRIVSVFGSIMPYFADIADFAGRLVSSLGSVVGSFSSLGGVMGLVRTAFTALTGPIGLAIGAVTLFITYYDEIMQTLKDTGFLDSVAELWKEFSADISAVIKGIVSLVVGAWNGLKDTIYPIVESLFGGVVSIISNVLNIITGIFKTFRGLFTGDWEAMWQGLKDIAYNLLSGLITAILSALNSLIAVFGKIGKTLGLGSGLLDFATKNANLLSGEKTQQAPTLLTMFPSKQKQPKSPFFQETFLGNGNTNATAKKPTAKKPTASLSPLDVAPKGKSPYTEYVENEMKRIEEVNNGLLRQLGKNREGIFNQAQGVQKALADGVTLGSTWFDTAVGKMEEGFGRFQEVASYGQEQIFALGGTIRQGLLDISIGVAETLGGLASNLITGQMTVGQAFQSLAGSIISAIGDFVIKIGTQLVTASALFAGVSAALASAITNPAGLALVGLGLIAFGGLLKGLGSSIQQSASQGSSVASSVSQSPSNYSTSSNSSASYASSGGSGLQTIKLQIDLTGAITQTSTGYQIRKTLERDIRIGGK